MSFSKKIKKKTNIDSIDICICNQNSDFNWEVTKRNCDFIYNLVNKKNLRGS